jgi:hypothetical protein
MLRFTCTCGETLKAPARMSGRESRCPACGVAIVVPEPAPVLPSGEFALKRDASDHKPSWPTLPASPAEGSSDVPMQTRRSPVVFASIEETQTTSDGLTDAEIPLDDSNVYSLAAQPPIAWVPRAFPEPVSDFVPPPPFQRSAFEVWCDPLTGIKFVFYLSGFLAVLTAIGAGLYPHVLHEGLIWVSGMFLAVVWGGAMALLIGYGCSFLDSVLDYALCGGARNIHVPDLDPRPAITSVVKWGLCFASGPALLTFMAFRHWIHCGDVTAIDGLILAELTMPAISYWLFGMLVLSGRPDMAWASPVQVFIAVRRLGWRTLVAGIGISIAVFVHVCVGAGGLMLLHSSWLAGLVMLWICWFSAWQCATYALWTLGFWHHQCANARRAVNSAAAS